MPEECPQIGESATSRMWITSGWTTIRELGDVALDCGVSQVLFYPASTRI